jgi:uncharacterized membrane protein YfcA
VESGAKGKTAVIEFDLTFFLVAGFATLWAAVAKGGFGSSAAFASAPILALILDPRLAVGLMLPLLMVMDVTNLKPYWKKWSWPNARALILGAVPGTAVGALISGVADADTFRLMIGAVALGFVAYQAARKFGLLSVHERPFNPWSGGFWGFIAGITSFISHAGGPPVAVHMLSQRLSKTEYQATSVIVFWVANWMKFVPYLLLGMFTWETAKAGILLAPVAVAGTWLGVVAHRLVPERVYFSVVYVMLVVVGLKLVSDGLT